MLQVSDEAKGQSLSYLRESKHQLENLKIAQFFDAESRDSDFEGVDQGFCTLSSLPCLGDKDAGISQMIL